MKEDLTNKQLSDLENSYNSEDDELNTTSYCDIYSDVYLNNVDKIKEVFDYVSNAIEEDFYLASSPLEEKLKEKMLEGWNLTIECKGIGRDYSMTFEGTAYNTSWESVEQLYQNHAVSNTIEELIEKLCVNKKK